MNIVSEHIPSLDDRCGNHFRYRDLVECGETFKTLKPNNRPSAPETYRALADLAARILDPIIEHFGSIELTYGVSCEPLTRRIGSRISPPHDQHASYELNTKGNRICPRGGAAVDIWCKRIDALTLSQWVSQNCSFDRIYFYGLKRLIHVSIGPEGSRQIILMLMREDKINRIPRKIKIDHFMTLQSDADLIVRCTRTGGRTK